MYSNKVNWDIDLAFKYLTQAVELGNKDALMYLGMIYYFSSSRSDAKDFFNDIEYQSIKNKKPHPDVPSGPSTPDYKKSFELFTQAESHLKGKNGRIYLYLGIYHYRGYSVDLCPKKALEYFERSYILGFNCLSDIYQYYKTGVGIDLSTDECLQWVLKCKGVSAFSNEFLITVYEARKDYDSAISLCRTELSKYDNRTSKEENSYESYLKHKLTLTNLIDKKKQIENEQKIKSDKIETLEKRVFDLTTQVNVMANLMMKMGASPEGVPHIIKEGIP